VDPFAPKRSRSLALSPSRRLFSRRAAISVALALTVLIGGRAAVRADDDDDDDDGSLAKKAAHRFPQPVRVGTLIDRTVLEPLESQPVLGHVRDLVRTSKGAIEVVVDYGGFFGFGARPIGVPVEAMVLLGQYMEIVDFTPAELDKFPPFDPGKV
jgi:hypothetical protein